LVNKYVVLSLIVLLFSASWFSKVPGSHDDRQGSAATHEVPPAPAPQEPVPDDDVNGKNEEDQPDVTNEADQLRDEAFIELSIPDFLPLYSTLVCEVSAENITPGADGVLIWYMDGKVLLEEWVITGTDLPGIRHDFEYNHATPETVELKAKLLYTLEQGGLGEIVSEKTVKLENHDKAYWIEQEAPRVLATVSDMYKGDFTLEWAHNNDYDAFDKEVFVNAKGYQSKTEFLIWVNRSHQRANLFKGSAGEWELFEVFIVGTGAPGKGTKRGVTYIPSRSAVGWEFGSYTVRPVVRFWPGERYAFHSRILHPRTLEVTDASIGFPVSLGCVRMYDEDVWYIYDNIPDGTTVVIH